MPREWANRRPSRDNALAVHSLDVHCTKRQAKRTTGSGFRAPWLLYLLLAALWGDLPICSGVPCAHPTCPNHLELSPGRMGWSWNRQNHPERPLWPREIISPRRQHRAPVGGLPPSPEQRDKAAPLGKGVKPPRRDWLLSIAYVRLQSLQRPVRRPCMQWPLQVCASSPLPTAHSRACVCVSVCVCV